VIRGRFGLRVDVDTHDGMRDGVPKLAEIFAAAGMRATFYLSMGPDRAGRAVFNLLRPGFLLKMTRTRAVNVYGWRTVLSGTLLPSRPIASAFPEVARRLEQEGHETGVHAWDHRAWQDGLLRFPPARVAEHLDRGYAAYFAIFGRSPRTYAAPAWLTSDAALEHEETFRLDFASDCRGREPFLPVVGGRELATPQVPSTLPTLDEALGETHRDAPSYFAAILDAVERGNGWEVFTLHAELEGGAYAEEFAAFLAAARARGFEGVPLGELLRRRRDAGQLAACRLVHAPVPGRHGVLSTQAV
jgi:undecaprenyl phosphate-alpha-L-ara4FN deformylase